MHNVMYKLDHSVSHAYVNWYCTWVFARPTAPVKITRAQNHLHMQIAECFFMKTSPSFICFGYCRNFSQSANGRLLSEDIILLAKAHAEAYYLKISYFFQEDTRMPSLRPAQWATVKAHYTTLVSKSHLISTLSGS